MTEYKLKVSPQAKKNLKKLSKDKRLKSKFETSIIEILQDPYGAGILKSGILQALMVMIYMMLEQIMS